MNIVYALEDLSKLTFPIVAALGPTPRTADVKSWRPSFIQALKDFNYKGTILIPETRDNIWKHNYDNQIEWEHEMLEKANLLTFWIPREMKTMPALTTNIEIGLYFKSGKILYGRPVESVKNSYIDYCYKKFCNKTPYNNIYDLAKNAVKVLDEKLTGYVDPAEAIKELFMREEKLSFQKIQEIMFEETSFDKSQILFNLYKLKISQFILYDNDCNMFYLNKDKIIKDIIE